MKSLLFILLLASNVYAENYILCRRDAEITPVNPTATTEEDPCSGRVILQGIAYDCTTSGDVESKRRKFLNELREGGREYCESFCAKRSTGKVKCHGVFSEPGKCGFTIPTSEALKYGKTKAVCNPECGGQAFAYCSIYHSSMLRVQPELFSDQTPNCDCEIQN